MLLAEGRIGKLFMTEGEVITIFAICMAEG